MFPMREREVAPSVKLEVTYSFARIWEDPNNMSQDKEVSTVMI